MDKIKVLWFEVTQPAKYSEQAFSRGGWQDSLENIVKTIPEIELYIAFESKTESEVRKIDSVTYIPIKLDQSVLQKRLRTYSYNKYANEIKGKSLEIIDKIKPDLIQVFGTEWPYGLITNNLHTPVVIHIQGSIIAYNYAEHPPRFSLFSQLKTKKFNPRFLYNLLISQKIKKEREEMEKKIWEENKYFMGRTLWDRSMAKTLSSNAIYFHVEEAIRPEMVNSKTKWELNKDKKLTLVTTGFGELRKGADLILETAAILKSKGIDFEWNIIGAFNQKFIQLVQNITNKLFNENNIKLLGSLNSRQVQEILLNSSIYIHTAYAENSPNSICEAQLLGMPVIAANVGGIRSLVRDNKDGILVPPNDPWQLANAIIELSKDINKMQEFSKNTYDYSRNRHNPENIKSQLLQCYHTILKN